MIGIKIAMSCKLNLNGLKHIRNIYGASNQYKSNPVYNVGGLNGKEI